VTRISLSASADRDLLDIFLQGIDLFGTGQAAEYAKRLQSSFEMLAEHPDSGREREDVAPGVRTWPMEAHVIVYRRDPDGGVRILRVRHGRENWIRNPLGSAS
jgi:toxin ParE1/3/4